MSDSTDIAVREERGTLARYVTDDVIRQTPRFAEGVTRHHRPAYDNYEICKAHIRQMLGNIDGEDGLLLFGRQVAVAVYCRPNVTPVGLYLPVKEIKEDWWQHKVVMVVKTGPDAFGERTGTESWHQSMFGDYRRPQVGDWVFSNAASGLQINLCGDGGSRPQGIDHLGRSFDLFEWDGWPVRIMTDDMLIGRIGKPHQIV